MKNSQILILVSILAITFVLSCSTKPRSILDEKKMVELLKDLYKADGVIKKDSKNYTTYQQKDALVDAVFKKHKVTNEQYEQSLDWYAENIDVYNAMIDTISERLQREYNFYVEQAKEDYQHKLSGFTTELPEYFVIDNNNPTFRFRIDSLNIKMIQPENFKFSFDTNGVDTFFHQIDAAVYFKYRDTIVINKLKIEVDSLYSFTKPELPDSLLKEISGYVHLQKSDKIVSKILLKDISNKNPESMNKSDSTNVSNTDKLDFKDQKLVSK